MSNEALSNHENVRNIQIAIEKATEIVAGGPGANPLEVFPDPADKERRADVVWGEDLSEAQQEAFRGVMAELGPGRTHNVGPNELGLEHDNYVALFEGGQPHKMIAQLDMIDKPDDGHSRPYSLVVSASTGRKLGDAEKSGAAKLLGIEVEEVADTEYGVAEQIIKLRDGFTAPEIYNHTDGQGYSLEYAGRLNGTPVTLMGIDRIPTEGDRYRQLSNQEKMEIVAENNSHVAFVTSATYQPSNQIAAAKAEAAITPFRTDIHVCTYGTEELARVKNTEPVEPQIAQLGAEAFKTAKLLQDTLEANSN
jgi:hypothetical protein